MERKTKHRLLGVLVIVGLVIFSLPFLQDSKEAPTETASFKAPPFPDQTVQMNEDDSEGVIAERSIEQPTPIKDDAQTVDNGMAQQPQDTITALHPSVVNADTSDIPQPATTIDDKRDTNEITATNTDSNSQDVAIKDVAPLIDTQIAKAASHHAPARAKKAVYIVKQVAPARVKLTSNSKSSIDNNGLFKLKSAVWVIQIGSFKSKTNALKLVNRLRANGYPAFIQQVASNTRVFVGPETKQGSARTLANQLKTDMHIDGVVISYKPLTL